MITTKLNDYIENIIMLRRPWTWSLHRILAIIMFTISNMRTVFQISVLGSWYTNNELNLLLVKHKQNKGKKCKYNRGFVNYWLGFHSHNHSEGSTGSSTENETRWHWPNCQIWWQNPYKLAYWLLKSIKCKLNKCTHKRSYHFNPFHWR